MRVCWISENVGSEIENYLIVMVFRVQLEGITFLDLFVYR